MSLPVDAKETGKASQHWDPHDPSMLLHESRDGRVGHPKRYQSGGGELDKEDRVDFADESESDGGIAIDDSHTDFEVVGQIILGRLVCPRVPRSASYCLLSKEGLVDGGRRTLRGRPVALGRSR